MGSCWKRCLSCFTSSSSGCSTPNLDNEQANLLDRRPNRPQYEQVSTTEGAPTDKDWFHANISHMEAERRLRSASGGVNGSYLVYTNPDEKDGSYVLIAIYKGNVYRWKIHRRGRDGLYVLGDDIEGGKGYPLVKELIKDHRGTTGKPIKTSDGISITLSRSYVYIDN